MEITKLFKATVKAVKARRRDIDRPSILPKSKQKSDKKSFHQSAVDLPMELCVQKLIHEASSITKLRDFLLKYQLEYLGEFSHLISISSRMTEEERDQIDTDTQTLIKSCSSAISSLKNDVTQLKVTDQHKLHATAVIGLLELYLKDICKLYAKQRAFRVKQTVDRNRMLRLLPDPKDISKVKNGLIKDDESSKQTITTVRISPTNKTVSTSSTEKKIIKENSKTALADTLQTSIIDSMLHDENKDWDLQHSVSFSPEEIQMLEEENELLYSELNSTVKEVRNIEGKVIEIGQLQEIFQEKVMSQSAQIENIYQTAVKTTDNVKEGNEQIREAIKNSATFRVWILFFLMMCTFSLLFLDWYNY